MKEKLPLVSFVIPTFNSERTIEKCLKSIRQQKYPAIEIIIVDGGSTDDTLNVAKKYADKIYVLKGTLGFARDFGIRKSKGEIIGIFDSDIYLPHRDWLLKAVIKLMSEKKLAIIWPINIPPKKSSLVSKAYFVIWENRLKSTDKPLPGGNILIKRKAYEEVNGINNYYHFGEDYELTVKIIKKGYSYFVFKDPIIHDTMYSLKQYTIKQFWGASSLMSTSDKKILAIAISWNTEKKHIISEILDHIRIFIYSIPIAIKKYKKLKMILTIVIMLLIRIFIYSYFYIYYKKRLWEKM